MLQIIIKLIKYFWDTRYHTNVVYCYASVIHVSLVRIKCQFSSWQLHTTQEICQKFGYSQRMHNFMLGKIFLTSNEIPLLVSIHAWLSKSYWERNIADLKYHFYIRDKIPQKHIFILNQYNNNYLNKTLYFLQKSLPILQLLYNAQKVLMCT